MKLLTEIEPSSRPLPDHLEAEVRIWECKLHDARVMQGPAAVNSAVVRDHRDAGRYRAGTERLVAEQYAYVRYLMGIDHYWLSTARTIHQRMDYRLLEQLKMKTPLPDGAPV